MRLLLMGWFSFSNGHATAGDLLSLEVVKKWLDEIHAAYDAAIDPPLTGGVNWREVNPLDYTHAVFICGPFNDSELENQFLTKFAPVCRIIGLNLSMSTPLTEYNPFDFLIERNSTRTANPDLVFASEQVNIPLIGLCLVEEYEGAMVPHVNNIVSQFVKLKNAAFVNIDTRLDINSTGFRTASEIETIISKVDVLITSRLHGLVLAIKNGIPCLAIDPEKGGSKILTQCRRLNWTNVINADELTLLKLQQMLDYALSPEARSEVLLCAANIKDEMNRIKELFIQNLVEGKIIEDSFYNRQKLSKYNVSENSTGKNIVQYFRSTLRKMKIK